MSKRRFEGRVAFITGGGSGMGRAFAEALAREGAIVVVGGRRREKLDEVVDALAREGHRASALVCDVTDEDDLVGSVASVLPTPGVGAYAASKFAVRAIGQTLSMEMAGTGVSCTTILPGFVESDIARVDNEGVFHEGRPDGRPARLMWKADDAARVCVDAIHARKREFVFTAHGKLGVFVGQHFPGVVPFMLSRLGFSKGMDATAAQKHARRRDA